ncbi:MAG: glycosyltransferase, partial [Sphingobacteriales bacterium]
IVHAHSFWTNIISRLATPKKVKLLNHYHFADYDTMKHKGPVKKMMWIDRRTSRKSMTRIAVSEYLGNVLRAMFPSSEVKVIPNFIHSTFHPKAKNRVDGQLKIIAVGNCNIEKNYEVLLDAFSELKDLPISIDIIGGGDKLEYYRNQAKKLRLDKVRFCGYVSQVREWLMNYDLFLSTSISETFGIAVLEGVNAGLPMILSDIPAYREIAPRGTEFFQPTNSSELAEKLKARLGLNQSIHLPAYEEVLEKYSEGNFLSELRKLFN